MQGDIFNAGQANLGRQFDITNQGNASQFNAGQANQARQFDVGNELDASKYNANQAFQGQQFDIGNELDASKANAGNALTAGTFNADLGMKGQMYNADARTQAQARNNASAESAAARNSAAAAQDNSDRLRALAGMSNLYGTTPGMSSMFGNQVAGIVGQGGTMGLGILNAQNQSQQLPGQYEQTRGRVNDMIGYANAAGNAIAPLLNNQNQGRQPIPSSPVQMSQNPYDILRNQPQYQMSLPPQQPSYYDEGDYGY
jgi:hypothetical protein